MSIRIKTESLVTQGRLIDRPSSVFGRGPRSVYVTPEIDAYACQPFPDTAEGGRFAALCAFLDAFSELNQVSVSENPHLKPPDVMLARVSPVEDELWSMRIIEPDGTAGIRVFGGFCAKDEFVALAWDFREQISDFDSEVKNLRQTWNDYFGTVKPYSGSYLDDYLTNYYEL